MSAENLAKERDVLGFLGLESETRAVCIAHAKNRSSLRDFETPYNPSYPDSAAKELRAAIANGKGPVGYLAYDSAKHAARTLLSRRRVSAMARISKEEAIALGYFVAEIDYLVRPNLTAAQFQNVAAFLNSGTWILVFQRCAPGLEQPWEGFVIVRIDSTATRLGQAQIIDSEILSHEWYSFHLLVTSTRNESLRGGLLSNLDRQNEAHAAPNSMARWRS